MSEFRSLNGSTPLTILNRIKISGEKKFTKTLACTGYGLMLTQETASHVHNPTCTMHKTKFHIIFPFNSVSSRFVLTARYEDQLGFY